ncbi:hypothetical protein, partial [Corynebacterium pygosceleis]|uniref:hypothetical protein n=1 Tax=Corynebacterium pygosceleis TaxID=2800406 RepID=UPI0020056D00
MPDFDWEKAIADVVAELETMYGPDTRDFGLSQFYGGVIRGDARLEEIWARQTAHLRKGSTVPDLAIYADPDLYAPGTLQPAREGDA